MDLTNISNKQTSSDSLDLSAFKVCMRDNRKHSRSYGNKMVVLAGEQEPKFVLIPPGVVHAYKNVGDGMGMAANYPNRLYAGKGKKEKVGEMRHESDPETIYRLDKRKLTFVRMFCTLFQNFITPHRNH